MLSRALGASVLVLVVIGLAGAQPPAPPLPCEDDRAATRIQLHATTMSQLRERGDFARELAATQKEITRLTAEVSGLQAKLKAATPAPPAAK